MSLRPVDNRDLLFPVAKMPVFDAALFLTNAPPKKTTATVKTAPSVPTKLSTPQDYTNPAKGMVFGGVFSAAIGMLATSFAGTLITKKAKFLPVLATMIIGGTAFSGLAGGLGGFLYGRREERLAKGIKDDSLPTVGKDIATLLQF